MLKQSYFLIMIKVADDAIRRNYLKEDLDVDLDVERKQAQAIASLPDFADIRKCAFSNRII